LSCGESKTILIDVRTLKVVSRLIADYPELGYKTVNEFVGDAITELLRRKGLEIGQLQTWMRKGSQH
jgi:hypothetical protein